MAGILRADLGGIRGVDYDIALLILTVDVVGVVRIIVRRAAYPHS